MLEECDTYIYDLHFGDFADIQFCIDCLKSANLEEQKTLILISNVMMWAETPRKEKQAEEIPKENLDEEENSKAGENENKNEEEEEIENEKEKEEIKKSEENLEENKEENENQDENGMDNKSKDEEEEIEEVKEIPKEYTAFLEEDYKIRVPNNKYIAHKEIEDLVLECQKDNLKVVIICAGILYGDGEITFRNHFKVRKK